MLSDPLFWLAIALALSPFVILKGITGKPTWSDLGYVAVIFTLRLIESILPRK